MRTRIAIIVTSVLVLAGVAYLAHHENKEMAVMSLSEEAAPGTTRHGNVRPSTVVVTNAWLAVAENVSNAVSAASVGVHITGDGDGEGMALILNDLYNITQAKLDNIQSDINRNTAGTDIAISRNGEIPYVQTGMVAVQPSTGGAVTLRCVGSWPVMRPVLVCLFSRATDNSSVSYSLDETLRITDYNTAGYVASAPTYSVCLVYNETAGLENMILNANDPVLSGQVTVDHRYVIRFISGN